MNQYICINESIYNLNYGKQYRVIDFNPDNHNKIRIINDLGRKIWVPAHFFVDGETVVPLIERVIIRDDLADNTHSAIEVDIYLTTGQRRWCCFVLPAALYHFGDEVSVNDDRIMVYCAPHQIVVTAMSPEIIHSTLEYFLRIGTLFKATLPI